MSTMVRWRLVWLLLAAALLLTAVACGRRQPQITLESFRADEAKQSVARLPDGLGGLQVGDRPPDFTLEDVDGKPVALADFAGRPLMINFWATWCAPCRLEMPAMQAAAERYAADGFVILALNQDESVAAIDAFYEQVGLSFPALRDTNSVVAAQYGAMNVLPSSFFIGRDGTIAAVHRGAATAEQIDRYIALILP